MPYGDNLLYNNTHVVEIINNIGNNTKNILIQIAKHPQCLVIKIRDVNDFSFNFTSNVDWGTFEMMKKDQCLEITFEEFHVQLIELLKQAYNKEMLLRIENYDLTCKMIFYERSRIKSLIFLIVHLNLTNQKEIIGEMSLYIAQIKEINQTVSSQLSSLKNQLQDKEMLLDTALTTNHHIVRRFIEDIKSIEVEFNNNLNRIENIFSTKIHDLFNKQLKLLKDVDILKRGTRFKDSLYTQTLFDLDRVKNDNLKQIQLIDDLKNEINLLHLTNGEKDKLLKDRDDEIISRIGEIESLTSTLNDLRRDNLEATKLLTQKEKTNDEIAKDLIQANTMLVNFTKQYDSMSKEIEQLKKIVTAQERTVENQAIQLNTINKEFDEYKKDFNNEKMYSLQSELFKAKDRVEELEKQNREAIKINTLLTKKLASGETFNSK